jgi:hypothetical protein
VEFYTTLKRLKTEEKCSRSLFVVSGLPDIVLHPDYVKKTVGFISPQASTEGGGEEILNS